MSNKTVITVSKRLPSGRPKGSSSFDKRYAEAFGSALKEKRILVGVSQESLADSVNVERSHFGKIERGLDS